MVKLRNFEFFIYEEYKYYSMINNIEIILKNPTLKEWIEYIVLNEEIQNKNGNNILLDYWMINNLCKKNKDLIGSLQEVEYDELIEKLLKIMSNGIGSLIEEKSLINKNIENNILKSEDDNIEEIQINVSYIIYKAMKYLNIECNDALNMDYFRLMKLLECIEFENESNKVQDLNLSLTKTLMNTKEGYRKYIETIKKKERYVRKNTVNIKRDRSEEIKNNLNRLKSLIGGLQ
jgi:hypothetical protein